MKQQWQLDAEADAEQLRLFVRGLGKSSKRDYQHYSHLLANAEGGAMSCSPAFSESGLARRAAHEAFRAVPGLRG